MLEPQSRRVRFRSQENLTRCLLPFAAALLGASHSLKASPAVATWLGNSNAGGDGTNWTNADNWSTNGVVDALPPNTSPGADITFGLGTVGTINLQGNEYANSLNFNAGFTLDAPGAADTLNLTTGSVTVGTGTTATINAKISGVRGLTLSGPGTLIITGVDNFGATSVISGTLDVSGNSSIGTSTVSVSAGGNLNFTSNTTNTLASAFSNSGSVNVFAGATVTYGGTSGFTFTQAAGALSVGGVLNIGMNTFADSGGTITGTVNLGSNSNSSDTLAIGAGAGNSGTFAFTGEGGTITNGSTGVPVIPIGVTVSFQPTATFGELSSFNGLTNNGTLDLISATVGINSYTPSLYIGSATLTNNGSLAASGTGSASISGSISNAGTVTLSVPTAIGGNVVNNASFDIASGGSINFNGSSTSTFTQNGGTLQVSGSLAMANGTFADNGGVIIGTVTLGSNNGSNDTLAIGAGAGNSGTFAFTGEGGTITNGSTGVPVIPTGVTVSFQPTATFEEISSFNGLTNNGTLDLISATLGINSYTPSLYIGSATLSNNGSLAASGTGSASISGSINNAGAVTLSVPTAIGGNVVNNATFNIASGGSINFNGGSSSTFTQNGGTLQISGSLSIVNGTFADNGGTITGTVGLGSNSNSSDTLAIGAGAGNSGTFAFTGEGGTITNGSTGVPIIPAGVTVTFQPTATFGEISSFNGLTNNGTLDLISSTVGINSYTPSLYIGSATLTNNGSLAASGTGSASISGSISNAGIVNLSVPMAVAGNVINNGTFDIASGGAINFTSAGSSTFTQNGGTLQISGSLTMMSGTFADNGGVITGTVTLGSNNGSNDTLAIGAGAGNSGTFAFTGEGGTLSNGSTGVPVIPAGVTVSYRPTATSGALSSFSGLTNDGTLDLIATTASTTVYAASLYIGTSTLSNAGSLVASGSGSVSVSGSITNTGTASLSVPTYISGNITNNGTFDIASGGSINFNGSSPSTFTQNGGTLQINGSLAMTNGTFADNGGTITGSVGLGSNSGSNVTLAIGAGAGNSGTFAFTGEGGTIGNGSTGVPVIPSGVTVTFQPTATFAQLNSFNGLTNNGTLGLIATTASPTVYTPTLYLGTNTLSNSGSLIAAGSGSASISGSLTNSGTVNLNIPLAVSGNVTNSGAFNIGATTSLSLGNGSTFTQSGGTLQINGSLAMSSGTFAYNGGSVNGVVSLGSSSSSSVTLSLGAGAGNSGFFAFGGAAGTLTGPGPITIPSGVTVQDFAGNSPNQLFVTNNLINNGTIYLVNPLIPAPISASLYLGSNTLTNNGTLTSSGALNSIGGNVNNAASGLFIANASLAINGSMTSSGTLLVASGQTLLFSGSGDSFTQAGGTTNVGAGGALNFANAGFNINAGTITLTADASTPAVIDVPSAVTANTTAVASIVPGTVSPGQSPGYLNLGGNTTNFNVSGAYPLIIGVPITNGAVQKSGTGTLIFAGANTYSTTDIEAGTLQIGNGGAAGTLGSGLVTDKSFLQFSRTDSVVIGNQINGVGQVVVTSGTVALSNTSNAYGGGTAIEGGTVTAPALSALGSGPLLFASGTFQFQSGAGFDLSQRTLTFASGQATINTNGDNISFANAIGNGGTGGLTKAGAGTLTLLAVPNWSGPTNVTGGSLLLNAPLPAGYALNIGSGASLSLGNSAGPDTLSALTIGSGGSLNIANDHLFINYGSGPDPIASIAALIASGFNGGAWNGSGIFSTSAQANAGSYGIGFADSADPGNPAGLASDQIEIKYTLLGDANLDGKVNGADFAILATNFNKAASGPSGWVQGDFNYDNKINGADFAALALNFNKGASGAAGEAGGAGAADMAVLESFAAANGLGVNVPEPALGGAAIAVAAGWILRRRKR